MGWLDYLSGVSPGPGKPAVDPDDPFTFLPDGDLLAIISDSNSYPDEVGRAAGILSSRGYVPGGEGQGLSAVPIPGTDSVAIYDAQGNFVDIRAGAGDGGRGEGPTAAELAIERSKVQSANLATYLDSVIEGITADIDAKRLSTDQAMGEFTRRLDAFAEGGKQFQGIQPFTIPRGVEYIPGFEPGSASTRLGREPVRASPIEYDPFGMATQIVAETPDITGIGVPSTDPLQQAIAMLRGYL